jgi:polysaccharide biosynthesis/export protein
MFNLLKVRAFLVEMNTGLWALASCLIAFSTIAAAADPAPTDVAPPAAVISAPAAVPPSATVSTAAAVSPDYRIGPGDSLHVFVFENDQLSVTVPVRPDGKISTPLVEDMVAVGKTPSQLARDIESSLGKYVKSPKVNVVVMVALSVYSQVKVIGQVKEPQALPFHEGMTVLEALLSVKGLSQFAAGNRARIVRTVNGKQQDIKVKLESLVNNGDLSQNLPLLPGDVLVVPETRF